MKVIVNGEPRESSAESISKLVEELGFPAATLLIEHNGTALHRSEWVSRPLSEGDQIEILRIAAGG